MMQTKTKKIIQIFRAWHENAVVFFCSAKICVYHQIEILVEIYYIVDGIYFFFACTIAVHGPNTPEKNKQVIG
jgi:hypothetical protein